MEQFSLSQNNYQQKLNNFNPVNYYQQQQSFYSHNNSPDNYPYGHDNGHFHQQNNYYPSSQQQHHFLSQQQQNSGSYSTGSLPFVHKKPYLRENNNNSSELLLSHTKFGHVETGQLKPQNFGIVSPTTTKFSNEEIKNKWWNNKPHSSKDFNNENSSPASLSNSIVVVEPTNTTTTTTINNAASEIQYSNNTTINGNDCNKNNGVQFLPFKKHLKKQNISMENNLSVRNSIPPVKFFFVCD